MRVMVTGAAGFVGRHAVARLLEKGFKVTALVRRRPIPAFAPHPDLTVAEADLRDPTGLARALSGAGAVVHLAAAKSDERDSRQINVGGARNLIEACLAAGCPRLINISTQSAKIARRGLYGQTKREADALFENSGLEVTTLLPSIIYGEPLSGVFDALVRAVRRLPVVPVLGDGRWISAPVHVDDVTGAVLACLQRPATIGKRYDLGGPDPIMFDALLDKIGAALGMRRPKVHIPFQVALALSRCLALILPNPPITVSNVLGSNQDSAIDAAAAGRDLGFNPISLGEGIQRTLTGALLKEEAVLLSRYLIDRDPSEELIERYRLMEPVISNEPELVFIRRHPRALALIDGGAGILKPDSIVRGKLKRMAMILETTPEHAEFFLKAPTTVSGVLFYAVGQVVRGVLTSVLGTPLFFAVRRGA